MKWKRRRAVCLSLSLFLLVAALAQIRFPELNNWKLRAAGKTSIYLRCEALDAAALEREIYYTEGYFGGTETLVMTESVVLYPPKDIPYYASPSDREPAYIVRAGEPYEDEDIYGYGFITWPTYSREWRYAKPFVASKEFGVVPPPYKEISETPSYYVRYEDLVELAEEQTKQTSAWRMYYYDNWLCDLGLYYSPNLPRLVFDWWNIGFLAAGVLLLAGTVFWSRKGREKEAAGAFAGEEGFGEGDGEDGPAETGR